jgi:tetratricopeptide (TPR) repeat protein
MRGVADVEADPTSPRYLAEEWVRDGISKYKLMLVRDYYLAGETDRALATLAEAAPIARDMTESMLELANIYALYGYYEESIPYYDRALEAFPRKGVGDESFRLHYAQILANKAIAYLHIGDVDAAEEAFRQSLEIYPDNPDIRRVANRENLEEAARLFAGGSQP